jgi:hypothetical protein
MLWMPDGSQLEQESAVEDFAFANPIPLHGIVLQGFSTGSLFWYLVEISEQVFTTPFLKR